MDINQRVTDSLVGETQLDDPLLEQWRVSYGHTPRDRERLEIAIARPL